jgi:hypothetical protein
MNVSWFIPPLKKTLWQKWYNYDKVMASVWIRCLQLIPYLDKQGIHSSINTNGKTADVAIFLRRWDFATQKIAINLKARGTKIVVDTPVNYFSSQQLEPFQGDSKQQFDEFIKIADAVFSPSQYITDFGAGMGIKTYCLPDSVDLTHFSKKKQYHSPVKDPVLIWSGVMVKSYILNELATLINKHSWQIFVISEKKPKLDFKFKYIKWSYKSFPRALLRGDIGIFPRRVEDEYDKGHSFYKVGVFLAQHIPVICTPVPSYQSVLTDLNSVKLESLDLELWENSIISMAKNIHNTSFENNPIDNYSTKQVALLYADILKQMVGENLNG